MLELEKFKLVVNATPLVSVDMILKNTSGEVLLGQRLNRPAQGFWFVPGGRILKNESIESAFLRLTKNELGEELPIENARFLGPFEHFYGDNFSGTDFGTHYVVLGYEVKVNIDISKLPNDQHNSYKWFNIESLKTSPDVHFYTKQYFLPKTNNL